MEQSLFELLIGSGVVMVVSLTVLLLVRNAPAIIERINDGRKQRMEHDRLLIKAGDEQADRLGAANEMLTGIVETLREVLTQAQAQLSARDADLAEAKKEAAALREQLARLEARVAELVRAEAEREAEVKRLREQVASLTKQLDAKQAEIDLLKTDRAALQERVRVLEQAAKAEEKKADDIKAAPAA